MLCTFHLSDGAPLELDLGSPVGDAEGRNAATTTGHFLQYRSAPLNQRDHASGLLYILDLYTGVNGRGIAVASHMGIAYTEAPCHSYTTLVQASRLR